MNCEVHLLAPSSPSPGSSRKRIPVDGSNKHNRLPGGILSIYGSKALEPKQDAHRAENPWLKSQVFEG